MGPAVRCGKNVAKSKAGNLKFYETQLLAYKYQSSKLFVGR